MNFFTKLKSKKNKKHYELLLILKDNLDEVSLNVSFLRSRIDTYKKAVSLSSEKRESYLSKTFASASKNNLTLCKKGFFKFYRENLIYNSMLKNSNSFSNEFSNIVTSLVSIQDTFNILEQNFTEDLSLNKFIFKDIFSQRISNFSNKLSLLSNDIETLTQRLLNISNSPSLVDSDIFENEEMFLISFNAFLKEYNITLPLK